MECKNCNGTAHPATGHLLGGNSWLCGPCAGRWLAWVVKHTGKKASRRQRKTGGVSFYEAAATSIKPNRTVEELGQLSPAELAAYWFKVWDDYWEKCVKPEHV